VTRARIAEGLQLLVLGLANPGTLTDPPDGWEPHEWAYVKGLASGEIWRLARLVETVDAG
jgi:hypothetical protein